MGIYYHFCMILMENYDFCPRILALKALCSPRKWYIKDYFTSNVYLSLFIWYITNIFRTSVKKTLEIWVFFHLFNNFTPVSIKNRGYIPPVLHLTGWKYKDVLCYITLKFYCQVFCYNKWFHSFLFKYS